ncbi:13E12 repeat family protein, partial [Mycolicibacterium fortuitum]|uniref:13E12 repeat family protein n=2 Tax=Mycolicibacterium fortuitum TaxID=1766 RepID=UPI0007EABD24
MFEDGSDAALIDQISAATRAESVAIAARLAAIGALDSLREQELADSILWRTDPFEEVAAEISAAMRIARGRAATQIHHARVLRDKLPLVAARFAVGDIDYRVVRMIIARTGIVDPSVWAGLDAELAARAHRWMRFSERQLRDRVDQWIAKLDPNGVRVPPDISEQRFVQIEPSTPGMASIWAHIDAVDAVALDQRLDAVANTVCEQDPRSHEQRRADAIGPLARLEAHLVCRCGREECPAAQNRAAADAAVVHVLAQSSTVDGGSDAPGYLPGHGILPAESVRNVATHAKIKPVRLPAEPTEPAEAAEPGYRPSAALSEFIRWRDLT